MIRRAWFGDIETHTTGVISMTTHIRRQLMMGGFVQRWFDIGRCVFVHVFCCVMSGGLFWCALCIHVLCCVYLCGCLVHAVCVCGCVCVTVCVRVV